MEEISVEIGQAYSRGDAAALRALAHELQTLGTTEAAAIAWNALGTADTLTGSYESALAHYGHALEHYKALGDRAGTTTVIGNMGTVYLDTGDYPSALQYYSRALADHEAMGDLAGVGRVTGNLGNVFYITGDYPLALDHYHRALAIHEQLRDRTGIAIVTSNMSGVFLSMADYPMALEYHHKGLSLFEQMGSSAGVASITGNLGNVYRDLGDLQSALEHYRRALIAHEELHDLTSIVLVTGNMITALLDLGDVDEARSLLEQQAGMPMEDPAVLAEHEANRARLTEHQGELTQAHEHLQRALEITSRAGLRARSIVHHKQLRDLAQKRNDFAGYIEHNTEYLRIIDEIRGKETTQRIAMMDAERRMEAERRERDKERALLYGALPESVATRMLRGEVVSGDHYESASVLFLDIVDFTSISDRISPGHVVLLLDRIFSVLDAVAEQHGVTKIKTIGDSYMAVVFDVEGSGVQESNSQLRAANAALEMRRSISGTLPDLPESLREHLPDRIQVRIGIHCGPVTAGVIGTKRLQYDVWGDTVNVASRMESTGEPGRIQVSAAFAEQLLLLRSVAEKEGTANSNSQQQQKLTERGEVSVKGKGLMTTYWLEGA